MTEPLLDTLPMSEPRSEGDALWATSPTVGRFVVLGRLGSGGMGVVLSAYDPMLDRRIALKLVRPGSGEDSERERRALLQREAQAMARLSHPNVVAVHDVGTIGEQLFIAMEFVDGQTLRGWLEDDHDWRDVVRMFGAVGSGLSAAHAAGLVHRDFKPENVLIGRDGRPRVGDFGLVGRAGEPGGPRPGAVMGTLGYMSPEQLRGDPSDAKSDQFSYCIALYEALDGAPPFAKRDYREAVSSGRVPPLPRLAPRWLGEVVLRGLRVERDDRWPDMGALIAALGRDPARSRRRIFVAAAVVAVAATAMLAAARGPSERRATCIDAREDLRDVWDGSRRLAVERAFAATKLPYSSATFASVSATLDRYATAWTAMHDEVCRAPTGDELQADSLRDLRMACLQARRSTLAALTDEWSHGIDAPGLEHAVSTAASLPSLDLCADTRALVGRAPMPSDPVARVRAGVTHAALDRVAALRAAGRMQAARTAAEAARKQALADDYAPVTAEASLALGRVLHSFGEPAAIAVLQDAVRFAARAGDDGLAADAAIELIGAMVDAGQAPSAIPTASLAEALVVRAGDRPAQRGALQMWLGAALIKSDRKPEGIDALSEARGLLTRSLGANDPLTLEAGERLYNSLYEAGDLPRRDALGRELLATELAVLGPDHPETGALMGRIGAAAGDEGDFDTADRMVAREVAIAERAYGETSLPAAVAINHVGVLAELENHLDAAARAYEGVLAIRRKLLAPRHPLVAHALANLAIAHRLQHHYARALDEVDTARDIMRQVYGENNNDVAYETNLRAEILADAGRLEEARTTYQQALAIWQRIDGPSHTYLAWTMLDYGRFEARMGRYADARTLAATALDSFTGVYGPSSRAVVFTVALLARCDLGEHGITAVAPLEAAMRDIDKPEVPPADRATVRLELARAEWAAGNRARARDEAGKTERELVQAGAFGAVDLERLRAWLATHRS